MNPKREKKGMNYQLLVFLLILVVLVVTYAFIYSYQYAKAHEVKEPDAAVMDSNFQITNFYLDGQNITFSVKRTGGIENYRGFQIFLEDSYGKVKSENVFQIISINEEKKISVNYAKKLANVKYATLVPIT